MRLLAHADQLRAEEQLMTMHDLKFAFRAIIRAPLFSLLAIVTLAVGIGANAALFAVVKPVLLDSLPYMQTERLIRIFGHNPAAGQADWGVSAGMADDLQRAQQSFSPPWCMSATSLRPTCPISRHFHSTRALCWRSWSSLSQPALPWVCCRH